MSIEQALEMAECVEINLKNLAKLVPPLRNHPIYNIVEAQIRECVKELEKEANKDD